MGRSTQQPAASSQNTDCSPHRQPAARAPARPGARLKVAPSAAAQDTLPKAFARSSVQMALSGRAAAATRTSSMMSGAPP
eukprot:2578976-Lingulodinium_polyedra.AAC.1